MIHSALHHDRKSKTKRSAAPRRGDGRRVRIVRAVRAEGSSGRKSPPGRQRRLRQHRAGRKSPPRRHGHRSAADGCGSGDTRRRTVQGRSRCEGRRERFRDQDRSRRQLEAAGLMGETFELYMLGGATEKRYRKLRPEVEAMPWGTLAAKKFPEQLTLAARKSWTLAAYQEHRTGAACAETLQAMIL